MLQIIKNRITQSINYLKLQDINQIDKLSRTSNFQYNYLLGVAMVYMMLMILSGILIYKIVKIGFFIGPAAIFVVPLIYCLSNVMTEVYGYPVGRNMMWWFVVASTIFTFGASTLIHLPSPQNFKYQTDYNLILGSMPRIAIAGIIGTICGFSFNNYVVSKLKIWMEGKKYWIRSAVSTCGGEIIYNIIAYPLMFLGVVKNQELVHIFISVTAVKIMMTMIFLTPECFTTRYLKIKEKINVFDYDVNYNVFKFKFSDNRKTPSLRVIK